VTLRPGRYKFVRDLAKRLGIRFSSRTASGAARAGPVQFQPIREEIGQLKGQIAGAVLNAGCGNYDITDLLKSLGAASVTNVDIATTIPGAIQSSLEAIPLDDDSFDTVFCNAVLEHVAPLEPVMAELVRVAKPGGRLVLAIPFLQPYHESPTDFRRFTADGMRQLGERHGLTLVMMQPVHSIAQTLGWILWEHLGDTRARFWQLFWWPIIWIATRIWRRGDRVALRAANTIQAVFEKPRSAG
jgi:SAM-dependent methyltransferase